MVLQPRNGLERVTLQSNGAAAQADASLQRRVFLALSAVILLYALLAGLKTVWDFDLPWQLATGRWIAQHHGIPSVDVFSYTAQGQPWIYPVGSGLFFYAAFVLGGYSLLSWVGAAACAGTIAILLRRGNIFTAALALLAVPQIAARTTPRADMFTVVLFAAFLSLLWEQHETGNARLWPLPLLMVAWVNLHLGFSSGLALLGAYILLEVLELPVRERRVPSAGRLRRALPWLVATCGATLINPWGWNIYVALFRQQAVMAEHSQMIIEWAPVLLNQAVLTRAFLLRSPEDAVFLLVIVSASAILVALLHRQFGAAVWLGGATFIGLRHVRFLPLFAEVATIVAAAVFGPELAALWARVKKDRVRAALGLAAIAMLIALAGFRSIDLVTNRTALASTDLNWFGPGLSWWFPEGAATFIERENIPGQIFNVYEEGGFVVWRLGPKYQDYLDGRAIPFGMELFQRNSQLIMTPPDSPPWEQEAERYNINAIIVPLGRYNALQFFPLLRQFCASNAWAPVYLDEVGAVFVRRSPVTANLIQRSRIDCDTAPIPATAPAADDARAFNQWANSAALLQALGRDSEALAATSKASAIFAGSAYVHFLRGNLLKHAGSLGDAEQEYLLATRLENHAASWSALADLYQKQGRVNEAIDAWQHATELLGSPDSALLSLGYAYLGVHRPQQALNTFDRISSSQSDDTLRVNVAHGRAVAWDALGNLRRATVLEEQVVRLAPDRSDDWLWLASLYQREGRPDDARLARQRAMQSHRPSSAP